MTCPVIMITGDPIIETATDAVRLGAYDYIIKPIKRETLTRITDMALQYKSVVEEKNRYQANLEAIFRSVHDAIITVDSELRVLEVNEAAEEICGFPGKEEVKGKKCESFMNVCSKIYLELITETINTKLPAKRIRFECGSEYQSRKVVSATTYPLIDSSGQINGCVMVVKDETRLAELESNLNKHWQFHNIIRKSEKMEKMFSLINTLSDTQTTVLITGENGTGKGLVAEALHYYKKDSKRPFVVVGCASLSDNLLESELFGHVKGAFTGAVSDRIGRFQKADGGTIFLDEIGDISNSMQLRLLRVLQEKEFERVGDSTPVKVNVRVIAATNQDLPSEFGRMSSTNLQHEKDDIERDSIIKALKKTGWNRAKAARLLGIGRTTLYARIEKYQITENRAE